MTGADRREGRSWRRLGCGAVLVVGVLGLLALVGTAGFALWQVGDERREVKKVDVALPATSGAPARLALEVEMAELVVVSAPPGAELRIEVELDPRRHELTRHSEQRPDGTWVERLRFVPTGPRLLSLARLKVGGELPRLRVAVPRDRRIRIVGWIEGGLAALELGGLDLASVELQAQGAAVQLSFAEPLMRPLERLVVDGRLGSVEVTGVGHASPRTTVLAQRLGELDIDLRGAWSRDADVRIAVDMAGGSAWLPGAIAVQRVAPGTLARAASPDEEPGAPPRLRLDVTERRGRLIIIDPRERASD